MNKERNTEKKTHQNSLFINLARVNNIHCQLCFMPRVFRVVVGAFFTRANWMNVKSKNNVGRQRFEKKAYALNHDIIAFGF